MTSQLHPAWEQQGIASEQQPTAGQQPVGGQQSMGGQQPVGGQQSQMTGGQAGGGLLPQEHRTALHSVAQAIQVCGWCADQCTQMADPHMVECVRLCEDVVELGETTLALAPRSSRFTGEILSAFQQAAQACAAECGQHSESHCQECATVLETALSETQQLSAIVGGQSGAMTQQMGQPMGQQF